MHGTGNRPRELKWYHAGPMLFGDWGTSRLYVLGLAFAFLGRASFWYVVAMCGLMVAVGWCYEIVCRLFPDGGGVYSAAKQRSQLLAVVGGLLLCADYVVTASLSCLDAFHYLGVHEYRVLGFGLDAVLAAASILVIGGLNYLGPTKTGTVAMVVALATIALTLVIGIFCIPHLGQARLEPPFSRGILQSWVGFTEIVLALSGVEAIANMTGIMVRPVQDTARKSIVPVMIEIVVLNVVLAAAMNTLADSTLYRTASDGTTLLLDASGRPIPAHTGDMLKVIATQYVHPVFASLCSFVFAALLLSAVNTAISALVSTQFMLSRDKELPHAFARLNGFGMPVLPLIGASIVPAVVLLLFPAVEKLADLYAIGVVGAIAINLGSTSTNPVQPLKAWERALMLLVTAVLIAVEVTILVFKPHAREFVLVVLVVGLAARLATITANKAAPLSGRSRSGYLALAVVAVAAVFGLALLPGEGWPASGLMAAVALGVGSASYRTQHFRSLIVPPHRPGAPKPPPKMLFEGAYKPKERIMVPTQGNPRLIEFALRECKNRQAELMILFVRHIAVTPMGPVEITRLEEDEQALELFQSLRDQAVRAGVPLRLLYSASRDIPDAILDNAVTHGADLMLLGTTRRGALWRAMKGDVIQSVAEQLPERVHLLIHA
jgi:amino acid transporter/nucleotide-binding universal stress UspA family protein